MTNEEVQVLVVDDVIDAAQVMAEAIAMDGYTVRVATGGEHALKLAAERRPHCVLLDIAMPGMDGLELARRLREEFGHEIVLIAMTGWGDKSDRAAGTIQLCDHFLRKPVELAALRKLLPRPLD
ncbi:MAG: response regulator [Burkholderiales bacterium]|nr:response regulator [Burkholderiales bacterium]